MFNPSLVSQTLKLSQIVLLTQGTNQLVTINNSVIEVDVLAARLQQAIAFKNCQFVFSQTLTSPSSVAIFTSYGVRVEESLIEIGLCIWGERNQNAVLAYIDQDGPNVFLKIAFISPSEVHLNRKANW